MNLINFHTYEENKPYIAENKSQVLGQGLYKSHNILLYGNGHNKYTFTVLDKDNNEYKVYIEEKHILEWRVRSKFESYDDEDDNIEFSAYGNFNNEGFYHISSCGCNDFDHIEVNNMKFEITDIEVSNDKPNVPLVCNIYDDYKFCDIRDKAYKEIYSIDSKKKYNLDKMHRVTYEDLLKHNSKKYYILDDDDDVIPFEIIKIEKSDSYKMSCDAKVQFSGIDFFVKMEIAKCFEKYEDKIDISFKFESKIFKTVYLNFSEMCDVLQ